jgi:ADP-ribose pyrophosphatase YjhB (NUDIX family)
MGGPRVLPSFQRIRVVHVPKPFYWLVQKLVPIACVDVLPWRVISGQVEICLISREGEGPGRETGLALVGGAVKRGETLPKAILRHLDETLEGDELGWRVEDVDVAHPEYAAQFSPWSLPGHRPDSRKHAIALTFIVELGSGEVQSALGEATGFKWLAVDRIPDEREFVFGHGSIVEVLGPAVIRAAQAKSAGEQAVVGSIERP